MPWTGTTAKSAAGDTSPARRSHQRQIAQKRLMTERHLQMPFEEWRTKKRQQWRALMNALDLFTYGSAYTPVGHDLYEMQKAADRIKEAMAEDWVCW
jgi:3-polyprenyl-4-hydroxybenzoate decarboxylase